MKGISFHGLVELSNEAELSLTTTASEKNPKLCSRRIKNFMQTFLKICVKK